MNHSLPSYPEYKDSGVPWLGEVPTHWAVLPNRTLFTEVNHRNYPDEELLSVTIGRGIIRQADLLQDTSKKDSSNTNKSNYKLVAPRDIVYNKMRAWQGAIGVSDYRGIVSPAYVVVRPRGDHNPRFFHYLLRTPGFASEAERWSYGITSDQWSLRAEDFKQIYCPLPPPDEQHAIVRYLDHIDRRIRRYIRARRRLIALLGEQKQAIIHQAVTRGVDPSVPLKPSGVEWLGDVPAHWVVKKFKYVTKLNSGQIDPRLEQFRDMILIAPNHIESGTGRLLCEETAHEQGADSGKYLVDQGQIVYSKIRPNLRKATIAPRTCLCSADMYAISSLQGELRERYLLQLLLSVPFTKYTVDYSMRVAMPKVNRDALGSCWLWYPSLEEQDEILKVLSEDLAPIDASISVVKNEIDLIREYRTRLIADVVTGKVDVRAAAASLPAEFDEPGDALDDTGAEDADLDEDTPDDGGEEE